MNSDVILVLKGYQDIMGDESVNDTVSEGKYYKKGSRHFVVFDGAEDQVHKYGMIKIAEGHVDVVRRGRESVHMSFASGKDTSAIYHTDAGDLRIGIFTDSVSVYESDDEIRAEVIYSLSINEAFISDSRVTICIQNRQL